MGIVSSAYKNKVLNQEIEYNQWQYEITAIYDDLLQQITSREQSNKKSLFSFLSNKKTKPIKGLYIYGKVGHGKTMLMDLFYNQLPTELKQRAHFNNFMLQVQASLNFYREANHKNPIEQVAKDLYKKANILCFDEFIVTDIADAMILSRLFKKLFDLGVILIATSNVAPKDLYKNGLNRDLFIDFIPLLEQNCQIINSNIEKDFRLQKIQSEGNFLFPDNADNLAKFQLLCQNIANNKQFSTNKIEFAGREILIEKSCKNIAYFTFKNLCAKAYAAKDYIEIIKNYNIIFLESVPYFTDEYQNWAKRFILLIDILYENNIRLFMLSCDKIENLYQGKNSSYEKFEFTRTASRLHEMQSAEYLNNWYNKFHNKN